MVRNADRQGKKLNIGSGFRARRNWINLDVRRTEGVDVVADARHLPFRDRSFDVVQAFDVLEHFGRNETMQVLLEWCYILKENGELKIKTPNLARIFQRWQAGEIPDAELVRLLYATQDYEENTHRCGFTPELLKERLLLTGFKDVKIAQLNGNDINNMFARAKK